ncbi:TonB family protein [Kingella negevensis]|uniref:energy transducer TonB n=1 Tax=Kingella negevensis TaxID=1522312 RepID=UPI0025430A1A|nr:energy transducer TonB [Kingella negevensis]WII92963.1 TonB family protein [Kingella negevensis]
MKTNPLLKTAVVAVVALAHAGLIALSWQAAKTADIIESGTLTMVDLGSLGDSGEPAAESAPTQSAPPPPPPPVQQKQPEVVKPKKITPPEPPKPVEQPKVQAVVRNDKPADTLQPEKVEPPKPKPKPVEPPKPVEQPKPVEKPKPVTEPVKPSKVTAPENTNTSSTGSNTSANSNNSINSGSGSSNSKNVNTAGSGTGGTGGKGSEGNASGKGNAGTGTGMNANHSVVDGGAKRMTPPAYPPRALENNEEGTVKLEIVVSPDKSVKSVNVVKSSGSTALDNAAKAAVRRASYTPKKVNGDFVPTRFTISIEFNIADAE